ncbi:DNA-binding protein [Enemella dayhoffiae]|uniref:DNA-binding protein n=1 Tax=Enemella dayhoffiae TaxID=2016507 RepID=A0A255H709_9ACTN|nr:YlxR family protein [Enemella dayhoffiae]OYO23066.1 DNA-binding protein [Enemella dayhoffiae]
MGERGGPTRTCVGCRGQASQAELLRVILRDGAVFPDPQRRLGGRGAYLHPDPTCIENAIRRRTLTRALRGAVSAPPDTAQLVAAYAKSRQKA